jgi:hypothetical protein
LFKIRANVDLTVVQNFIPFCKEDIYPNYGQQIFETLKDFQRSKTVPTIAEKVINRR